MAGKLPGVETARRRRFRGWSDSSSVFNYGRIRLSHGTSTSFMQRSVVDEDEKLGGVAREAKQRLDWRLRRHWKSHERSRDATVMEEIERRPSPHMVVMGDLQTEVFGLKNSGSKRFGLGKFGLNWKSSDQDECTVCLDQFKTGEKLVRLSCAHRFHSKCLLPWLEANSHCPCCRMEILGFN